MIREKHFESSSSRPGVCTLMFPVILREGEKFFALPDGWVSNAIPAIRDFGLADSINNLTVSRRKKIIATGSVSIIGKEGYATFLIIGFTEGTYPIRLYADRFEVGDEVKITFCCKGEFPVLEEFVDEAVCEGMEPSLKPGTYSMSELTQATTMDAIASAGKVLPGMEATKTIILRKRSA